ncbi:MAG: hypothetical protein E7414_02630 [Ruminococcaceae bacterium]|nr:hypothetical protein [Oscillospiraceae bacterium]
MAGFSRQGHPGVGLGSNILPKDAIAAGNRAAASRHEAKMLADIKCKGRIIAHENRAKYENLY